MREQPELLRTQASRIYEEAKAALLDHEYDLILLAARGSSDHAALYARYLIEINLGIPVSLAAPSVITRFGSKMKYPKTLAIGISQSGAAPDVSEVLAEMSRMGHATLAITNTPNSRITEAADRVILLNMGAERSIAATKTYTGSLLAIYQLVRALGADLPAPDGHLPGYNWVEQSLENAQKTLGPIVRCSPLFCLGRGYSFCTAFEIALKLIECALLPCKAYSTADFAHGPRALAAYGSAAIVFGETPKDLSDTGCVVVQAPAPAEQSPLTPIWEAVYGQWLALLAARARGIDPDESQNISKITQTF